MIAAVQYVNNILDELNNKENIRLPWNVCDQLIKNGILYDYEQGKDISFKQYKSSCSKKHMMEVLKHRWGLHGSEVQIEFILSPITNTPNTLANQMDKLQIDNEYEYNYDHFTDTIGPIIRESTERLFHAWFEYLKNAKRHHLDSEYIYMYLSVVLLELSLTGTNQESCEIDTELVKTMNGELKGVIINMMKDVLLLKQKIQDVEEGMKEVTLNENDGNGLMEVEEPSEFDAANLGSSELDDDVDYTMASKQRNPNQFKGSLDNLPSPHSTSKSTSNSTPNSTPNSTSNSSTKKS